MGRIRMRSITIGTLVLLTAFTAGCTEGGDADTVTFNTDWSSGAYDYVMVSDRDLSDDLRVVITEEGSSDEEEFSLDDLDERVPGRFDIASDLEVVDGGTYRIEAFAGKRSLGARDIIAREGSSLEAPDGLVAEYDIDIDQKESSPDEESRMRMSGEMVQDASRSVRVQTMSGSGTADVKNAEVEMQLKIKEMASEERDGETTEGSLVMEGTWKTVDGSGSGTVKMQTEFVARGPKRDAAGTEQMAEKSHTLMDMRGTIRSEGVDLGYHMVSDSDEWARVDDGESFWQAGSTTTTITYPDGTEETSTEDFDEAKEEEDDGSLMDDADFDGLQPEEVRLGDRFRLESTAGLTVQFVVEDGGIEEVAGQDEPLFEWQGKLADGATGTMTLYVVSDGANKGLVVSWTGKLKRGGETLTYEGRLVSVD